MQVPRLFLALRFAARGPAARGKILSSLHPALIQHASAPRKRAGLLSFVPGGTRQHVYL